MLRHQFPLRKLLETGAAWLHGIRVSEMPKPLPICSFNKAVRLFGY